eukprot:scaffold2349_cov110-Cylindrotheca_fusiformis.AAC.1
MQHPEVKDVVWIYSGQKEVPETVRRVKIAENITEIPDEAFQNHQELEEVILSSSVQVIGKSAFEKCKKLKTILYQGLGEEKEVGIPSTVKVIDERAFYQCKLLERLGLNEGLEVIGESAFLECLSLTEVDIPSTVKVIDDLAFWGCEFLTRVGLSEGLELIGESAFFRCRSLIEVSIPSTVEYIDDHAFDSCENLGRLGLNEGLKRIGQGAFNGCESLIEVNLPSTVQVIDHAAFGACHGLKSLGLNEGLKRIGRYAFLWCTSLSHFRIPKSVNIICTGAFSSCWSLISMELPEESSFNICLSGCRSLVNVATALPTFYDKEDRQDRRDFFHSSKLGSLVDGKADLKGKLKHRFDNSPVNKLCYYQSYQSLDVAMAQLRSLMEGDLTLDATSQLDTFGMTPLHVLSLSQTPNVDMLLAVIDAGNPGHMVRIMDSFGCTPMDYLSLNRTPCSSDVIRRVLQIRFDQVLGLDQFWKSDMLQAIDEALAVDWSSRKCEIGRLVRKFERKEALSMLELCLWKVKIDEIASEQMLLDDRQSCRINCGAAIVMPLVLPFLDKVEVEESFVHMHSPHLELWYYR